MAHVLVTGGAGFIGSHLCKKLAQMGHHPVAYDDLSRGRAEQVLYGPLVVGRLHDQNKLIQTVQTHQIEAVIHLAAYAYVEESTRRPHLYFENNLNGTFLLLDSMRQAGLQKLVFSSSCSVYGEAQAELISETQPCQPINPYGLSKLLCERLIRESVQWGLQSTSLRYFNAAGADPEGELSESHEPETHILPRLVRAARRGEAFTLYGKDYPTSDGSCVRDFIHVTDLASAHVKALNALLEGEPLAPAYNLGSGQGVSLRELVRQTERVIGLPVKLREEARRAGDAARLVADPSLFQARFGWQTELSDLESLIQTTR